MSSRIQFFESPSASLTYSFFLSSWFSLDDEKIKKNVYIFYLKIFHAFLVDSNLQQVFHCPSVKLNAYLFLAREISEELNFCPIPKNTLLPGGQLFSFHCPWFGISHLVLLLVPFSHCHPVSTKSLSK